jgi:glutathione synthase/RimK-type ligase-like ATP-grasp enzyme
MGILCPHTYGIIDPGEDYRGQIRVWFEASSAQALIIKPLCGRAGGGIVLATKINDDILIRSAKTSLQLNDYVLAERSIVQEVLLQDARMAAFSPYSVNTLRVVTMLTQQSNVIIVGASMRSGVAKSFVDNWSAGGVSAGIDCEKGKLRKYAYDIKSNRYRSHPTTGVVFEDYPVPEWERICRAAAAIQIAFPFYRMLGLDIAIEQSGKPVLIEINGAPDFVAQEQWCGPLLKSKLVLRAFGEYDLLVNRHQRKLYSDMESP